MEKEIPLVDKEYLLEKFPGKGGWTYASIPEVLQDRHAHFGWVRVRGSIDQYTFSGYHLMPMGNGQLFLPVKATVRKMISKQAGDTVRIVLYADNLPTEIPNELLLCFEESPGALEKFRSYSDGEQKAMLDDIYSAKTDTTKVVRIAKLIDRLLAE